MITPASVMAAAHVALDQAVEVREEQGRIVIEPVRSKQYKLDELLGGINAMNLLEHIDTGAQIILGNSFEEAGVVASARETWPDSQ